MSAIPGYVDGSTPAALYELVARGQKDRFFFAGDGEPSERIFHKDYESVPGRLQETRTTTPLNAPDFGRVVEFELETWGDILTAATVLVDLPPWFKDLPLVAGGNLEPPTRSNRLNTFRDISGGTTYGYTNGIGYYLFERVQIYQDQFLIQDITGDSLYALNVSRGNWNSYFLDQTAEGIHDGTERAIAHAATPGRLRLRLPFPGLSASAENGASAAGFPLCALRDQKFRIRLKLRALEDLIESSDGQIKPQPWGKTFRAQDINGGEITAAACDRLGLGRPTLLLETTQMYVAAEIQDALRAERIEIPYHRYFDQDYNFGPLDYAPLSKGGVAIATRRIEGRHPVERMVFWFRSQEYADKNQLIKARAPNGSGEYYNWIKLVIAGKDREFEWSPTIWHDVESLVKDTRDSGLGRGYGEISWVHGPAAGRQPTGAVNFTQADRPTLHVSLVDIPASSRLNQQICYFQVCCEAWAVYEIQGGRGRIMFAN